MSHEGYSALHVHWLCCDLQAYCVAVNLHLISLYNFLSPFAAFQDFSYPKGFQGDKEISGENCRKTH